MTHKYGVPKPTKKHATAKKPIPRKSRPTASNPTRKAREFARCYHSRARVEFVKSLRCVSGLGSGEVQNHHIEGGGAGRKAHYTKIVPMGAEMHARIHQYGREWFERTFGYDLNMEAIKTEIAWQKFAAASHV